MAKRKRKSKRLTKAQKARRKRLVGVGLTILAGLAWAVFGPELREVGGLAGAPVPERGDHFRVVSWNLANFRGAASDHDLDRIREVIAELDPDVIAVQEIKDREALAAILPEYELRISDKGGRGRQLLGVAWRRDRVELVEAKEHAELSIGGRVRPAFAAYLRGRDQGPDLWIVVVHLKAMPDGIELRRQQWPMLVELAATLDEGEAPATDTDLIVLGDFNTTGPREAGRGAPAIEQAELATVLESAGLRRLVNETGCTAYYDGQRRDAWKEASEIDLVWARGLKESLQSDAKVHSGTHCAAKRCEDARSTEAYPLHDYAHVSDHCPVIVDLARADDDP